MSDPTTARPYDVTETPEPAPDHRLIVEADHQPIANFRAGDLGAHFLKRLLDNAYQAGARAMRDHLDPLGPLDSDGRRRGPAMSWDSIRPDDREAIMRQRSGQYATDPYPLTSTHSLKWRYVWGGDRPGYWEPVS